jgi:hypothetical protein
MLPSEPSTAFSRPFAEIILACAPSRAVHTKGLVVFVVGVDNWHWNMSAAADQVHRGNLTERFVFWIDREGNSKEIFAVVTTLDAIQLVEGTLIIEFILQDPELGHFELFACDTLDSVDV